MAKLTSTLPANNGLFFDAGGQHVYYLSGDVKDAAQLPALVWQTATVRSRGLSLRTTRSPGAIRFWRI